MLPERLADLNTGDNIVATVFEECRSMYRANGPVKMPGRRGRPKPRDAPDSALKEAEFAATLPSSTYRTPSSRPICFASTGFKGGIAGNNEAGPPSRLKRCST
ncbi:MAG TPA: hypothetical protein VK776_16090 [Bryobacteraceae bacterium]|nr:hypothetical protein [Bryobacteraceae bacterium]